MRNRISLPGIIIFAFIVAALPTQATQTATGSLSGTIKDQTGAVITGAQVSIRNDATGETKTASTGDDGRFKFDKLAPGAYTVSVSQTGFKPSQRTVAIEPGRPASI